MRHRAGFLLYEEVILRCPDLPGNSSFSPSSRPRPLVLAPLNPYIRRSDGHHAQTAAISRWITMNALTVLSFAAVAACGSALILGHPGIYGTYAGLLPQAYTGVLPAAAPVAVAPAPVTYNVAPVAYNAIPYAPIQSQYHAQDELGQYSFGYAGGPSARSETRDAFGVVRGSYNYVDSEGKVQTQHYVADALGFRVAGTNIPVGPDAPKAAPGPLPEPVQDTPEVSAAKAAFKVAYDEAAAAAAAAPDARK
ncbi:cuticle protein 7-like [Macrobrachium nipponense]|uniref:cuticle protein 7-like n=1 Tax=Macrobrachium nipponense TaxID=159736 RepID=UPI0030C80C4A